MKKKAARGGATAITDTYPDFIYEGALLVKPAHSKLYIWKRDDDTYAARCIGRGFEDSTEVGSLPQLQRWLDTLGV